MTGNTPVHLANGDTIAAHDVDVGMVLATGDGNVATVKVVTVTRAASGTPLVDLGGGLLITPNHPVMQADGGWARPSALAPTSPSTTDGVLVTVVLEREDGSRAMGFVAGGAGHGTTAMVCIALGHGVVDGPDDTGAHPYFGSARVVADLQLACVPRDDRGRVLLNGASAGGEVDDPFIRDPSTGHVVGLVVAAK